LLDEQGAFQFPPGEEVWYVKAGAIGVGTDPRTAMTDWWRKFTAMIVRPKPPA
jgi:hypothetical protein